MQKTYTLEEMIEIVYQYAAEQRRVKEGVKGKDNIAMWVKSRLFDRENLDKDIYGNKLINQG